MESVLFIGGQKAQSPDDLQHREDSRRRIEASGNEVHALTMKGTEIQEKALKQFEQSMKAILRVARVRHSIRYPD